MSEAMFRALLGACGHTGGMVIPDGPPQAAGAPPKPPHGPCQEYTMSEAAAYRQGQEDERVRIAAMILGAEVLP